jgi:hypothetical protein
MVHKVLLLNLFSEDPVSTDQDVYNLLFGQTGLQISLNIPMVLLITSLLKSELISYPIV